MKVAQPDAQQRRWREEVRALGCMVTGGPAEIHHCVGRTGRHNKVDIGHWWILPLTTEQHRGPNGIHAHPERKLREKALFEEVLRRLNNSENRPPDEVVEAIRDYRR